MACLVSDVWFELPDSTTPESAVGPWTQYYGDAIANYGGDIEFNAGVLFEENLAASSGDGGVGGGVYTRGGVLT